MERERGGFIVGEGEVSEAWGWGSRALVLQGAVVDGRYVVAK